jgi:hypothetical protein
VTGFQIAPENLFFPNSLISVISSFQKREFHQ